ncbi:MAG: hypothetical protein AVDCRST_MAG20-2836 [uncultured Acidimicrobiales bacterium]|uniref:Uncharacterized protein n=1 Tax=uncultured Acidimicrobiales bacterium TaxID=310071 RepID=A0A6J4IVR7_9ACTN|nr:MAG: hypothetical protein AVDCRST_MAG20-2836 [uncultured Acidimicrobiales bacterium]
MRQRPASGRSRTQRRSKAPAYAFDGRRHLRRAEHDVVPGEAEHRPPAADERVLALEVVLQGVGGAVAGESVDLEGQQQLRVSEVDAGHQAAAGPDLVLEGGRWEPVPLEQRRHASLEHAVGGPGAERPPIEDPAEDPDATPSRSCVRGASPLERRHAHEPGHERPLDRLADDAVAGDGAEVDERPQRVRDRDPVSGRAPPRVEITRAVHRHALEPRQPRPGDAHLDSLVVGHPPEPRCAPVGGVPAGPAPEHRGLHVLLPRPRRTSDAQRLRVHALQAPGTDVALQRALAPPELEQLAPAQEPVLASCCVGRARPTSTRIHRLRLLRRPAGAFGRGEALAQGGPPTVRPPA